MSANVGNNDRIMRAILGVVIIAVGVYSRSWWGAIGAVPLLTALTGWCPAYTAFGMSTCRRRTNPK